jgi:CDP-4-dehydro-6-deoxyglucose reductase, E1
MSQFDYKNIATDSLREQLSAVIAKNIHQEIIPGQDYIPVTGKVLDVDDILHGVDATLDAWLTTGRYAKDFEKEFAAYFGSKASVLVNSGSSANLVAFYSLTSSKLGERAIKPGDEVITVAAGFPTTINPMIQFGCIPVFCGCGHSNLQHQRQFIGGSDFAKNEGHHDRTCVGQSLQLSCSYSNSREIQSLVD